MTYRFQRLQTFLDSVVYAVQGDGLLYRIVERRLPDAGRAGLPGNDAPGPVSVVYRRYRPGEPMDREVVAAFNEWRRCEHVRRMAHLRDNPALYGLLDERVSWLAPPPVVRGAHYAPGVGWIVDTAPAETALPAAGALA